MWLLSIAHWYIFSRSLWRADWNTKRGSREQRIQNLLQCFRQCLQWESKKEVVRWQNLVEPLISLVQAQNEKPLTMTLCVLLVRKDAINWGIFPRISSINSFLSTFFDQSYQMLWQNKGRSDRRPTLSQEYWWFCRIDARSTNAKPVLIQIICSWL